MVVNIQAGGLGKTLFEASFCVMPNSLLGKENKNSVICFAFLSLIRIFVPYSQKEGLGVSLTFDF